MRRVCACVCVALVLQFETVRAIAPSGIKMSGHDIGLIESTVCVNLAHSDH